MGWQPEGRSYPHEQDKYHPVCRSVALIVWSLC